MNIQRLKWIPTFILISVVSISCGDDETEIDDTKEEIVKTTPGISISYDETVTHQTIAGFGGANQMWGSTFPNASDMAKAFGMGEDQLGFSIFRVRIASNPNEWPAIVNVAKEAQSYGAKILASPWSPPAALKNNNSDVGGHLLQENYQAYVDHINDFLDLMESNGITIHAISIQNEPDIQVSYESCDWASSVMRDFVRDYGDQITKAQLAAPESFNFNQSYTNVLLNDDGATANLDIVAGHIYGGGLNRYELAEQKNKEIWMTEYLLNLDVGDWQNASDETKWAETLTMLNTIHEAMNHNWNAYIWWYLKRYYSFIGDGSEGTRNGEILKRGYAFSHFSKFVRPGYERIEAKVGIGSSLQVTAFKGENETVIVIINPGTGSKKIALEVASNVSSSMLYTTDINIDLEPTELLIEDQTITTTISASSVNTIVLK